MNGTSPWLTLETWLVNAKNPGETFTSWEYANAIGIDGSEASRHIQDYQRKQRLQDRFNKKGERIGGSDTLYVLRRIPGTRTLGAKWTFGYRTTDMDKISQTWATDLRYRFMQAVAPDLHRIAAINPRAAKKAENTIETILDGALKVLSGTIKGLKEQSQ
jgi:hypothetical protein